MERPEAIYIARLHRARSSIQNKFSAVAMWPSADQYRLLWELAFSVIFIHVYIWDRLSSVVVLKHHIDDNDRKATEYFITTILPSTL